MDRILMSAVLGGALYAMYLANYYPDQFMKYTFAIFAGVFWMILAGLAVWVVYLFISGLFRIIQGF